MNYVQLSDDGLSSTVRLLSINSWAIFVSSSHVVTLPEKYQINSSFPVTKELEKILTYDAGVCIISCTLGGVEGRLCPRLFESC